MKVVRVRRGDWAIQWPDGVTANGYPSRAAAERDIPHILESERCGRRRMELVDRLVPSIAPTDEVLAAIDAGTVEALEQLAAQYGLLKPGTQGVWHEPCFNAKVGSRHELGAHQ